MVLVSLGHICFKRFALKPKKSLLSGLVDPFFGFGVFLFGSSTILSIVTMRFIVYSVFYSFTALNYMFISILSKVHLKEHIDRKKVFGNIIIITGILVYNL
jgi:drug/metabolite transporter (DMT)-like permease